MEKNPGFSLTLPLLKQLIYSIVYGDLLMMLANQTRPYENNPGDSDAAVDRWADKLVKEYQDSKNVTYKKVQENIEKSSVILTRSPLRRIRTKLKWELWEKFS